MNESFRDIYLREMILRNIYLREKIYILEKRSLKRAYFEKWAYICALFSKRILFQGV